MIVTKKNFDKALSAIVAEATRDKALCTDSETFCLNWWDTPWYDAHGIKPGVFAWQFATKSAEYYFDFLYSSDKLTDKHFDIVNRELCANPDLLWFIANAKFDLHQLANYGVDFKGTIHCTKAIARVVNNVEPSLSLEELGTLYLGAGKSVDMAKMCQEKGFVTKVKKFGYNDKYDEVLHFDRIDAETMIEYGKIDVRRCFDLGVFQVKEILRLDEEIYSKIPPQHDGRKVKLSDVMCNEQKLTKVLFKMEREGVLIDRKYTEEAYEYEVSEYRRIAGELDRISAPHVQSQINWLAADDLKLVFEALGLKYSYTQKGNAKFDKEALEDSDSELAKLILQYRYHYKKAHTYFENFIWLADRNNVIHADAQQAGTVTGRMSYWNPNLQNVSKRGDKEDEDHKYKGKYKVRRCIIPKPGTVLLEKDYKGAEYYMSMDYARQMDVVEELKAGLDPHKRLGAEMSLERDSAKTMQFRILYGGGGGVIGRALGYKGDEADRIGKQKKKEYFKRVPALHKLICAVSGGWINGSKVIGVAESRGYVFNWLGRMLKYAVDTAYKAFNGMIQSGVGDLCKVAMVRLDEGPLKNSKTCMLIQIHDAILFQFYLDELDLLPAIDETMCRAYPHKVLPMKTDTAFSNKSWADLHSEIPPVA